MSEHKATVAGTDPKGHWFCTCGRRVHALAFNVIAHTSGKARYDANGRIDR